MAFNTALALQRLGYTARGAGDIDQARRCFGEALDIFQRIGSPWPLRRNVTWKRWRAAPDLPGIEQGVALLRERLASDRRTP